jgi:cytochrome c-type biogenesis protein CcmH/NrfG
LLLDRRRIRKWGKWVALFLAIVFAGGFLFLGVGYGGAGFNLSSLFTGKEKVSENPQTPDEKIAAYEATLQQNPNDTTALLGLATIYQQNDDLKTAASYLEKVIAVDPSQKDVYLRLANLYMNENVADYGSAVTVLNKLTSLDPSNPDVYLKLGIAQRAVGNSKAAILAWQKYLELAPNGDMASVVKDGIAALNTTTTTAGTSTTAASGTTPTSSGAGTTATTAGGGATSTASTASSSTTTSTTSGPTTSTAAR